MSIRPGYELTYTDHEHNVSITEVHETFPMALKSLRDQVKRDYPTITVPRTLLEDREYECILRFLKTELRHQGVSVSINNLDPNPS